MKNKVILLVEDNPDDELLTRRALQKNNICNVLAVARDGAEALAYLENAALHKSLPAVILLDLNLPKIGGLDVLRSIRAHEHLKRLPVVILTSSNEDQDICISYDLGANSYIRKPVDFVQFTESVRQLGFYWLLLNEAPPRR